MTNVSEWSVTAGLNNSAPPNGWPEGMARSAVNDCAREMMAALAKWYTDARGVLITAGTSNAFTLTTNSVYTAFNDIPLLVFRTDRANTGAATLTVDGLASKPLRHLGSQEFGSGEIASGQILVVAYNAGTDQFETLSPAGSFASGTRIGFQQTAAPSGWTKEVSGAYDNCALRLTTGTASSGGGSGFTSIFTSRSIAQANLPNVNFFGSTSTVVLTASQSTGGISAGADNYLNSRTTGAASATVNSGGSGTAMDFAVAYIDFIIATKV
jgi:hypothetical protein